MNARLMITAASLAVISGMCQAQTVNWRSLNDYRYLVNVYSGWDYSASVGATFGYKFKTKLPLLVSANVSIPFGANLTDDGKVRLGGQAEVLRSGGFSFTLKAYGVIRKYHSSLARFINFGSEFAGVAGYYRKHWFVAGEFGFDKAICTHIKNSDVLQQEYPGVKNGWYVPTGGNFFYGFQAGTSVGKVDIYVLLGKTISQDLKTGSAIPAYVQLGVNVKFQ